MRNTGIYGKGAKAKATKLHSQVVRARGFCQGCGKRPPEVTLQACHIVGRRYNATRSDELNGICACPKCHMRWTEWPLEFAEFVERTIGKDAYEALRWKAQNGVKANDAFWLSECERLTKLLADIEGRAA